MRSVSALLTIWTVIADLRFVESFAVKNPVDIRIVNAAIIVWILRCAQNDSTSVCIQYL